MLTQSDEACHSQLPQPSESLRMIESVSVFHLSVLAIILLLAALGVPLARKFVYGYFHGVNVFVFVEANGKTLLYKNPREVIGLEDDPLEIIPAELSNSERYETFYNVCWFDCGTLIRCKHSFHSKPQSALYCDKINVESSFIAKVMEER
jgi:hypothetical protein